MAGIRGIGGLDPGYVPLSGGAGPDGRGGDFSRLLRAAREAEDRPGGEAVSPPAAAPPGKAGPGFVPQAARVDKTDKLYEQCQALETFLVKNILSGMRKNVLKSNLLDAGYAGEIYEDMLWDEYAKGYVKGAGFGLADLAYLELTGQRGKVITP
ncbi:MAG: rod-binding protein [Treponema sp.]|jgi:flagellar protein FlgJ|nr:rod-binding protein [Treponema sp.]